MISSEEIETRVFMHRSLAARPTHVFEDTPKNPSPDNELFSRPPSLLCVTPLTFCFFPRAKQIA